MRLDDLSTSSFSTVRAGATPAQALTRLGGRDFAVVLDDGDQPIALLRRADLKRADAAGAATLLDKRAVLPPTIVVGAARDVSEVTASQLMGFVNLGARGAVLLDDAGASVVGVVTFEALLAQLYAAHLQLAVMAGASGLGGDPTTPLAKVKCKTCGHVNNVPFIDKNHPPECQNTAGGPHPLGV